MTRAPRALFVEEVGPAMRQANTRAVACKDLNKNDWRVLNTVNALVSSWSRLTDPFTAEQVAETAGLDLRATKNAVARLKQRGIILREGGGGRTPGLLGLHRAVAEGPAAATVVDSHDGFTATQTVVDSHDGSSPTVVEIHDSTYRGNPPPTREVPEKSSSAAADLRGESQKQQLDEEPLEQALKVAAIPITPEVRNAYRNAPQRTLEEIKDSGRGRIPAGLLHKKLSDGDHLRPMGGSAGTQPSPDWKAEIVEALGVGPLTEEQLDAIQRYRKTGYTDSLDRMEDPELAGRCLEKWPPRSEAQPPSESIGDQAAGATRLEHMANDLGETINQARARLSRAVEVTP